MSRLIIFLSYKGDQTILVIIFCHVDLMTELLYPHGSSYEMSMTNLLRIIGLQYSIVNLRLVSLKK